MRSHSAPPRLGTGRLARRRSGNNVGLRFTRVTFETLGVAVRTTFVRKELLGKGGFAKCYRCVEEENLEKQWAVKVVTKRSLKKKASRKRNLQSEIEIHTMLEHPNIVRLESTFEDAEHVYILMPLCRKETLMDWVRCQGRLQEDPVRGLIAQLIDVLEYFRERHIIHRDLKLSNIFLSRDNPPRIQVGDFGLAVRLACHEERMYTLCGTPNYLAPEVLDAENGPGYSFEIDIWCLGVIMYTLLVGTPPFETASEKTTYQRIKANMFSFPEQVPLSDAAKCMIRCLLRLNPARRPTLSILRKHPWMETARPPPGVPSTQRGTTETVGHDDATELVVEGGPNEISDPTLSTRARTEEL